MPFSERSKSTKLTREDLTARQWVQIVLKQAPPETIELLFGVISTTWGIWVAIPWFDAFAVSPRIFRVLTVLLPDEFIWGTIMALVGLNILSSLYRADHARRYWSMVLLQSVWTALALSFLISDWRSTGWITYLIQAAFANWVRRRILDRRQATLLGQLADDQLWKKNL